MDDIDDTSSTASPTDTTASVPAVEVSTSAPDAAPSSAPSAADASAAPGGAPTSMVEAMFPAAPEADAAKAGDPAAPADPAAAAAAEAKPGDAEAAKPDATEDLTKMPEGLTPKAQERFQRLANENKDYKARIEDIESKIEPFRQSLQSNGVTGEQFTLATHYIGAINRGDFEGAYQIMTQELQQLSLMMGKPLDGVDALASFPDLRQAVDEFQVTEKHALEIAKNRQAGLQQQQRQQKIEERQQAHVSRQQAIDTGIQDIDKWSKEMAAKDMDFPHIEKVLKDKLEHIMQSYPPGSWVTVLRDSYDMMKAGASQQRSSLPPSTPPLRPTGSSPATQKPKTMAEAMWGSNL